jgi:hypothetical protein
VMCCYHSYRTSSDRDEGTIALLNDLHSSFIVTVSCMCYVIIILSSLLWLYDCVDMI